MELYNHIIGDVCPPCIDFGDTRMKLKLSSIQLLKINSNFISALNVH